MNQLGNQLVERQHGKFAQIRLAGHRIVVIDGLAVEFADIEVSPGAQRDRPGDHLPVGGGRNNARIALVIFDGIAHEVVAIHHDAVQRRRIGHRIVRLNVVAEHLPVAVGRLIRRGQQIAPQFARHHEFGRYVLQGSVQTHEGGVDIRTFGIVIVRVEHVVRRLLEKIRARRQRSGAQDKRYLFEKFHNSYRFHR